MRRPVEAAESTPAPEPAPMLDAGSAMREFQLAGEPFALRVEGDSVSFCDQRGRRRLDLRSGAQRSEARACPKDEGNGACGDLPIDVTVSTPNFGPEDRMDLPTGSYWPGGRVHDCVADERTLAAITGQSMISVDVQTGKSTVLADEYGDHIAIGPNWIVWEHGAALHALRR